MQGEPKTMKPITTTKFPQRSGEENYHSPFLPVLLWLLNEKCFKLEMLKCSPFW
jgi:hypothetical protein